MNSEIGTSKGEILFKLLELSTQENQEFMTSAA